MHHNAWFCTSSCTTCRLQQNLHNEPNIYCEQKKYIAEVGTNNSLS